MRHQIYNSCEPIDPTATYLVDFFERHWRVSGATEFVPGGRFFVMYGRNLQALVKQDETAVSPPSYSNMKKRNECFLARTKRVDIINAYQEIFYCRYPPPKTKTDFINLCVRVRNDRFQSRLRFSYLIVKSLQCKDCNNKCVYNALKIFYQNESKCVAEVDRLIAKEC